MSLLTIVFLGTAAATPTRSRGLSSLAILRDGELLIFDAGEGTQRAISEARLGLNRRTKIFITHLHGDHSIGLLGIIQSMSLASRDKPLHIYGPRGLAGFIRESARYIGFSITFPLYVHEVREGLVAREEDYRIRAMKGLHSSTNFAYILDERERRGAFRIDKAIRLGIPKGELWSRLQKGRSVRIKGKLIRPIQVLGRARKGRKIGISGDTRPTPRLIRFFSESDVLIFDSTFGEEHSALAREKLHSTAAEAARVCKRSRSKLLILTHFSSRYTDVSGLEREARRIHRNTRAAHDMMRVVVPYPGQGDPRIEVP